MLEIKNKQLQIGIFETSSQNKSILEFFFKNAGKSVFNKVLLDECSAIIVDYDYPGAKNKWEETYNLTQKPGIIISIKKIDLPSTIWVSKPISSQALLEAGIKLQERLEEDNLEESSEAELKTNSAVSEFKEDSNIAAINYDISIEEFNTAPENTEIVNESKEEATSLLDNLSLDNTEFEGNHDIDTSNGYQLAEVASEPELFNIHEKFNTSPENTEIVNESKEEATSLLDNLSLDNTEFEGNHDIDTNSDYQLAEVASELELFNTHSDYTDSAIDDVVNTKLNEETSIIGNEDDYQVSLERRGKEELNVTKSSDLEIFLEVDASQLEVLDEKPEGNEFPSETNIENEKVDSPPIGEVDSLLASLIEQNDEEEANQIELIDIEDHTSGNSIIMAEEEEILPTELAELSRAYEENDTNKPVIIHEGSSFELNGFSEPTDTPLSPEDELQALLDEIRQEAEASQVTNEKPSAAANSETRTTYIPSAAEDRWTYTCGTNHEFTQQNTEKTTYQLKNHLLFLLTDTVKVSRESEKIMRIKYQEHDIVICTSKELVYCDSSIFSGDYAEMCFEPMKDDDIKVHSLDESEVRMFRTKMKNEPNNTHSLESFMWTTGLVTSRGRITSETDMNQAISLKHWPDIPRLESIPNAMRISAVFAKHPGSLKELIKWLRVEQRYVLAFYNAALALSLIEFDQDKFSSASVSVSANKTNTKNHGFFSRLLKRIKS